MNTNIIKIMLLGGVLMGATSCNDFLDQTSPSEHTEENIFNSIYYTGTVLNKAYGQLTHGDGAYTQVMAITTTAGTDCEIIDVDASKPNSFTDTSERGLFNYSGVAGGWSKILQAWDALYSDIEYCNRIIDGINGSQYVNEKSSNGNTMRQYKAEAQVIRAMVYFDLVKNFGDVPFKTEGSKSDLSNIYKGKTDRDVILSALIDDLEDAIPNLPWADNSTSFTTEHVNKGYAHALLAQIALQRAGWAIRESDKSAEGYITATDGNSDATYPTQRCSNADREKYYKIALSHLSTLIASGKHQLNPSYENEWYLVNQRKLDAQYQENLFEIPMGVSVSGERGYMIGVRVAEGKGHNNPRYGAKGNASGKIKTTAPFFMSFADGDSRRDITCVPYTITYQDYTNKDESGNTEKGTNTVEKFDSNKPFGIYIGKWDVRKMNEAWRAAACATTDKCPTGINEIKMRYSQVLLLYAEALNELHGPDDATDGVNGLTARKALAEVHTRAFNTAAEKAEAEQYVNNIQGKEGLFNAIVQENAWELCGEGYRKYDLERWNLLSQKIDEAKQAYINELNNGEYPTKLYYKTKTDASGNVSIDMSSVCWKVSDLPEDASDKTVWNNTSWWGSELADDSKRQNIDVLMENLYKGLNTPVKNRYLIPLHTSTIADANGLLKNSYGF